MRSSRRSSGGRATACRDNPAAWITTTARNHAIDRVRRASRLQEKTSILAGLEALRPPADEPAEAEDDSGDPGRPAAADLHLLPPGARARGAGRAHAARARRARHGRDRARVPGRGADHGAAARAGQAQDQGCAHPVRRAARPRAARPAAAGAGDAVPDLQRGLLGDQRATSSCGATCAARRSGWPACSRR